jgi:hypothetical protein
MHIYIAPCHLIDERKRIWRDTDDFAILAVHVRIGLVLLAPDSVVRIIKS